MSTIYNQTKYFPEGGITVKRTTGDQETCYLEKDVKQMGEDIEYLEKQNRALEERLGGKSSNLKTAAKAEGIALGVLLILAVMAVAGVSLAMRIDPSFNTNATNFFTHLTLKQGLLYFGTPGFSLIGIALAGLVIAALKDRSDRNNDGSVIIGDAEKPAEVGCLDGMKAQYAAYKEKQNRKAEEAATKTGLVGSDDESSSDESWYSLWSKKSTTK